MKLQTKTTFRIDPDVYSKFESLIRHLGLRRDSYLNRMLPDEIELLGEQEPSSARGAELWKSLRSVGASHLHKVSISLAPSLLRKINRVCEEKRILRDLFLERFLDYANESLGGALSYLENLRLGEVGKPYASLFLSDEEASRLWKDLSEKLR